MKVIKLFYCSIHSLKTFKTSTLQKCFAKLTNNSLTKHLVKYATLYTHPNSIQKIEQTHVKNALLMKKELSTGACKLFIFSVINYVKRKKCLPSGRKITSVMESYIIWKNQWDNYICFSFISLKKEKNLVLRRDIKYQQSIR